MMQEGRHILLSDHERRLVDAVKKMSSELNEIIDSNNDQDQLSMIELAEKKLDQIEDIFCDLIRFMGLNPDDPSSNVKMMIEIIDLFHRTVPRNTVETAWSQILGPAAAVRALVGQLNPVSITGELIKIIASLKIDVDGWVTGLEDYPPEADL